MLDPAEAVAEAGEQLPPLEEQVRQAGVLKIGLAQ